MMSDADGKSILEILHLEDSAMDSELFFQCLKKKFDREFRMDQASNEKEFVCALSAKHYD